MRKCYGKTIDLEILTNLHIFSTPDYKKNCFYNVFHLYVHMLVLEWSVLGECEHSSSFRWAPKEIKLPCSQLAVTVLIAFH
jgi:hypothetical protein